MRYAITHITRFAYDSPVSESHMEVRMQPRTGERQTCLRYLLDVEPRARPHAFRDHLSNWVDYFSVPSRHQSLTITARADVQVEPPAELPRSLDAAAWREVDEWSRNDAHWDLRKPSSFAVWTPALIAYAESIPAARGRSTDPLSTAREITSAVHRDFEYAPDSTRVNSTIDEALGSRKGVCQDLSHITVALLRRLDLPARYVSGYLAPAAATWMQARRPARHTHGSKCCCRNSDGSGSIPRTTSRPASGTFGWRSDATMRTCRRRAACAKGWPAAR